MILSHLRTAVLAAFPGLDAPKKAFFRVVTRNIGRLNIQPVAAIADQTKDVSNVEVCPGVPGVTSDPTEGETCIVMFVGKDEIPYVIGRAALDMPGHLPQSVRHDAVRDITFVSKNSAKVFVGIVTVPVAKAFPVDAIKVALLGYTAAVALAPTLVGIVTAAAALQTALQAIPSAASTRLEAE